MLHFLSFSTRGQGDFKLNLNDNKHKAFLKASSIVMHDRITDKIEKELETF